jgi:hypothetical protein
MVQRVYLNRKLPFHRAFLVKIPIPIRPVRKTVNPPLPGGFFYVLTNHFTKVTFYNSCCQIFDKVDGFFLEGM